MPEQPPPTVRRPEPVRLADLRAHPRNYRVHPADQIAHLVTSMREHGVYRSVVLASDGRTILAGHGVVQAARLAGLEEVLAVRLDVPPEHPRALKLVAGDNEIGRLAEINDRILTEILKEVKDTDVSGLLGTGFDEAMLANLVMVSRPASEIADLNEAAEWVGMPEYDAEDGVVPIKLVVTFKTEEDRAEFVKAHALTIDKKAGLTWSTRWPFTEHFDASAVRFVEGAAPAEADGETGEA